MKRRPDDDDGQSHSRGSGNDSSDSQIAEALARFFHKNGRLFLYAAIALGVLIVVVVVIDRLSAKGS